MNQENVTKLHLMAFIYLTLADIDDNPTEKEMSIVLNIAEQLNKARPDAEQGGYSTFKIGHKELDRKKYNIYIYI